MIENLISNISDKSIQNFIRSRNSSFKEYKEDLSYILQDKTLFQNLYKLGEISYGNSDELLVFYCAYKGELSSKSSKRTQFEIAKKVLKEDFKDGAIFVFYDDKGKFRFSFIRKNYGDKTEKLSNWKRFTYFVDKQQQTNRTFIDTIGSCNFDSLEHIQDKFNLEPISKEFFKGYKDHYEKFCNYMLTNKVMLKNFEAFLTDGSNKAIRDYVKKLLGRIVFLQFLQKKGWMGVSKDSKEWVGGDTNFLENLFKCSSKEQQENFLDEVLEPMFFNSLNSPRENDLYDTKTPMGIVKIPYLNGGLFEKDNLDEPDSKFPSKFFKELFEFFNRYNFTIDENDPNDAEVGVDPEMLGHIFENLLEDNKDKGAYYTPKEIVHYMCQESLIDYLNTSLKIDSESDKKQVSNYIKYHDLGHSLVTRISEIEKYLDNVKICDPAIGSGAFPMGLLHEIFHAKQTLWLYNNQNLNNFPASSVKLNIIQSSIYGVDIEKGAVDIARLRFWLSLVVDEEKPQPLPNLDYKIVVGNSLLNRLGEVYVDIAWDIEDGIQTDFFNNSNILERKNLLEKINNKQKEYFNPNSDKNRLAAEIRRLKIDLIINQLDLMVKSTYQETVPQLRNFKDKKKFLKATELYSQSLVWKDSIDKLEQLKSNPKLALDFFNWNLDFPEVMNGQVVSNVGFDIVIGNPPYVIIDNPHLIPLFKNEYLTANNGKINLYKIFIEKGITLLNNKGTLYYINPNTYLTSPDSKILRELILNNTAIIDVIEYTEKDKVFENVTQAVTILGLKKIKVKNHIFKIQTAKQGVNYMNQNDIHAIKDNCFIYINKPISSILKIQPKLFDFCQIFQGEINLTVKKEFFSQNQRQGRLPMIRGNNVGKYELIGEIGDYCDIKADNRGHYKNERIVTQQVSNQSQKFRTKSLIIKKNILCGNSTNYIIVKENLKDISLQYLLAIINSSAFNYYFNYFSSTNHLTCEELLFVPTPRAGILTEKYIVEKVNRIIDLKSEKKETNYLEQEIDNIVYRLYALSYNEVKVIDPEFRLTQTEYESISID